MLQIKRIELLQARIPRKTAFEVSRGTFVAANRVFVRVTLENRMIGYGECSTLEGKGDHGSVALYSEETQAGCFAVLERQIAPALIGADALNMAEIHRVMASVTLMNPQAKAGVG